MNFVTNILKAVFFAACAMPATSIAGTTTLELERPPHFPLRGPSDQVSQEIQAAHAAFVCWTDGVKSITPEYARAQLQQVTLVIANPSCGVPLTELVFSLQVSSNGYDVLSLVNPAITDTLLDGYPGAELILSLIDLTDGPHPGTYSAPLYSFRMILQHDYSYDHSRYGGLSASFETEHGWRQIANQLIHSYVVDDQANCDPRFPDVSCPYTVSRYRQTLANTLTGREITWEYEQTSRH